MSEIPEDIMKAADQIAAEWGSDETGSFWAFGIAKSVLEERNRCLSIIQSIETTSAQGKRVIDEIVRKVRCEE